MNRPARWERCLARKGAKLLPLPGQAHRYGVFPGGDQRRRPLARLDEDKLADALSSGRLEICDGQYRLSDAGKAAVCRMEAADAPSRFAAQHRDMRPRPMIDDSGAVFTVSANRLESPLGRLRDYLFASQIAAGERLYNDFVCSSLNANVTQNWSANPVRQRRRSAGADTGSMPLARIAAKDRVMDALDAVGPDFAAILTAALFREESLAALERRFGWGARSARTVLGLTLAALARHYDHRQ